MTLRTAQAIGASGTAPTFTAATASDTTPVGDRVWAEYRSTHTATTTITVTSYEVLQNGDTAPAKVYTLGIGSVTMAELRIPLYSSYQSPTTGVATLTTSQQTLVTMAVVSK